MCLPRFRAQPRRNEACRGVPELLGDGAARRRRRRRTARLEPALDLEREQGGERLAQYLVAEPDQVIEGNLGERLPFVFPEAEAVTIIHAVTACLSGCAAV